MTKQGTDSVGAHFCGMVGLRSWNRSTKYPHHWNQPSDNLDSTTLLRGGQHEALIAEHIPEAVAMGLAKMPYLLVK